MESCTGLDQNVCWDLIPEIYSTEVQQLPLRDPSTVRCLIDKIRSNKHFAQILQETIYNAIKNKRYDLLDTLFAAYPEKFGWHAVAFRFDDAKDVALFLASVPVKRKDKAMYQTLARYIDTYGPDIAQIDALTKLIWEDIRNSGQPVSFEDYIYMWNTSRLDEFLPWNVDHPYQKFLLLKSLTTNELLQVLNSFSGNIVEHWRTREFLLKFESPEIWETFFRNAKATMEELKKIFNDVAIYRSHIPPNVFAAGFRGLLGRLDSQQAASFVESFLLYLSQRSPRIQRERAPVVIKTALEMRVPWNTQYVLQQWPGLREYLTHWQSLQLAVQGQSLGNEFAWDTICRSFGSAKLADLKQYAARLGIDSTNMNKAALCKVLGDVMRNRFLQPEARQCDPADLEPFSMENMGSIPAYRRFKIGTQCFDIFNLKDAIDKGQTKNPFTREQLPVREIEKAYVQLKPFLGKQSTFLQNVRDTPIMDPRQRLKQSLVNLWTKLNYPPPIESVMNASNAELSAIWENLLSYGLVDDAEQEAFEGAETASDKLKILLNFLDRFSNLAREDTRLVALEDSLTNVLQGRAEANARRRRASEAFDEDQDDSRRTRTRTQGGKKRSKRSRRKSKRNKRSKSKAKRKR